MKTICFSLIAATLLAAPLAAETYRAQGRVDVTPVQGGFAIQNGNGMGARGMWCGAADYAHRVLGASGTQRIYVVGPRTSQNRRAPVIFSLNPQGTTPVRASILGRSTSTAGSSLSVDHAISFCADFKLTSSR